MAAGFIIDFVIRKAKSRNQDDINTENRSCMRTKDHCHCEKEHSCVFIKAHLVIFGYILIISFILNTIIHLCEERKHLAASKFDKPVIGPMVSALVGLIPNCASSVVITQLYIEGIMPLELLWQDCLAGSGVGILVLFKKKYRYKRKYKNTRSFYMLLV